MGKPEPGRRRQVQDIVCDPSIPGRLYLVSGMEGVYRSDDDGESWRMSGEGLVHNRAFALAVDPKDPERLYVGTLYGLHTSTNAGRSYDFIPGSARTSIAAIAVDPFDSAHIIASQGWTDDDDANDLFHNLGPGRGTLFVSHNSALHWEKHYFEDDSLTSPNVYSLVFDPARRGVVYVGGAKGVFRSTDGGRTFMRVASPEGVFGNRGLAVSPDGEVLYAVFAADEKAQAAKVFTASTRDWAWQAARNSLPTGLRYWHWKRIHTRGGWNSRVVCWQQAGKLRVLYAAPEDTQGSSGLHFSLSMSADGGETWEVILSRDQVQRLRSAPPWFPHIAKDYRFIASGLAAHSNDIVVAFYDHRFQKGYGVFRGTFWAGEKLRGYDWTDHLPFAGFNDSAIVEVEGKTFFYGTTPGMGLWRREWPAEASHPTTK